MSINKCSLVADDTVAQIQHVQSPEVQYQATLTSPHHVTQHPAGGCNPQAGQYTESVNTGQQASGQSLKADQGQQTIAIGQYSYPVISSGTNINCSSCCVNFQPRTYVFKCITPPCASRSSSYIICRSCHDNGTHKEHTLKVIMYVQ